MKILSLLVVAILASVAVASVVELTPENFDKVINGSKSAFIDFYAPWCIHCKKLAPYWDTLGATFENSNDVIIAKVDADAHRTLAARFDVHAYPTLKWFPKGETSLSEEYHGTRDLEALTSFVTQKSVSNVVILDAQNFDYIVKDSSKDVLVEFYTPWCERCEHLASDYELIANAFATDDHIVIAKIDCDAYQQICATYDVDSFPTIKWYPKDEKDEPLDFQSFVDYFKGMFGDLAGRFYALAGRFNNLDDIFDKFIGADKLAVTKDAGSNVATAVRDVVSNAKQYYNVLKTALTDKINKNR